MIGRKNLHVTAERANFPLGALNVRAGSAANVALFDVPVRAGVSVTAVWMRVVNCDGESADYAAVQTGTLWVVDVPAAHFATPGEVPNGVEVWASGTGADGEPYTWNIGVGDLCVLDGDSGAPVPGDPWTAIRLRETVPDNPVYGDAKIDGGAFYVWDGTTWVGGGGGGGTVDDTVTRTSSNAVKSSGIWSAIWGTLTSLPTGFTALYDWVVAQLTGKLSTSGGRVTGDVLMNRGSAVVFGEASGPAVYTRNGTTLEADTRGTTGAVALLSDIPAVPTASSSNPVMDGTAAPGSSAAYARGDHRHPTDTSRQPSITASGILKGNGSGGVTAAVAGTDYQAPLSAYTSTPSAPTESGSAGSSTAYARGDHVHPAETLVVTATLNLANMTVGNLSHTFSEILAARQAGREVLLEANTMTSADEGGRLLAWCSAEFGSVSGQSLQIGQLWFSAFMYTNVIARGVYYYVYYGAVRLNYNDTAALYLTQLADQGDLAGKLSTTGDTRTVTATDSGGTETYKFAGTGDTDANTVARVKNLPYVNEGEAGEMLVGVYAISSRGVQRHTATSGETSATFGFADTPGSGRILDAILDIDNSANSSALGIEFNLLGEDYALAVTDGDDLAEITELAAGERARFYFTETAQRYTPSGAQEPIPVISIQRMTIKVVTTQGGA